MSSDNSSSNANNNPNDMSHQHQRRGSVASIPLTTIFRSNSISQPSVTGFPIPISAATMDQRRRLSVSTFGLSGTSPTTPSSFLRRASLSTNESLDESAIDDEDSARTAPTTPFGRRMSFGANQAAIRGSIRAGVSPGTNEQGFNWSDQLRSRAESTVAQSARPSFSFSSGLSASPPRGVPPTAATSVRPRHDRTKSVSDMPAPPAQQPSRARVPQKPDPFQERILKGDFYMD